MTNIEEYRDENGWIRLEDSLPNILGCYLVCFKDKEKVLRIGWAFFNSSWEWFVDNQKIKPTHWMELPKPPVNQEV